MFILYAIRKIKRFYRAVRMYVKFGGVFPSY